MSAKQLRLIILTLAVVLLLWGASERLSRGSDTVTGGFSLSAPAPADVDTISLIKGKDSIVLARQSATAWTVNGRRAALDGVMSSSTHCTTARRRSSWRRIRRRSAASTSTVPRGAGSASTARASRCAR